MAEGQNQREKAIKHHDSILFVWLASIRLLDADTGARLVKVRAESKMQSQLAAAALITKAFHFVSVYVLNSGRLSWALLLVAFSILLLAIVNYVRQNYIFQLSVINHYYAISKTPAEPS